MASQPTDGVPSNQSSPVQPTKPKTIDINKTAGQYAAASVQADRQKRQYVQKYSSFNSLAKDDKIEAVKDLSLNPNELTPYDALTNSLHRWKVMASAQEQALDSATQGKAAANYYDKVLLPIYQRLGSAPIPRDLWLQKAYTSALKYDTKYAYDPSDVKGLINGYAGGMSVLDRIAGTSLNLFGDAVHGTVEQLKGLGESFAHPSQGMTPYFNAVRAVNTESKFGTNFFEKAQEHAESLPWYGYIDKHVNQLASTDQFWHDAVPAKGFLETAGSVITEQSMQLPLYHGISAGIKALGLIAEGVVPIENLTHILNATPVGRQVLPLMFAGVEGAVTGAAMTAPGEDWKREAWQSALGFTISNSVFKILGHFGYSGFVKLKDVLKGAEKDKWDASVEELKLGTQGQHVMSPQEERSAFKKVFAGYVAASGKQGVLKMFDEALVHLAEHDNMSSKAVQTWQARLLKEDRAHWNPVMNVAASIKRLMGPDALVRDMTDSQKGLVRFYFNKLVDEATAEIPQHVPQVQKMAANTADAVTKTPAGEATIKRRAIQMKNSDAKSGMNKGMTDQEYLQRAHEWYQDGNVKGAASAAKKNATEPIEEEKNINSRRKDVQNPGTLKTRSQYQYDAKGRISGYSMRSTQDFNVYASRAAKDSGKRTIKQWLDELPQDKFAEDLQEWFYPKDLADGGFFWEHGNSENRPNFLAFMYNYKDFMPKEVQEKLEDELISTPQVQAHLNGKVPSDRILRYYALQTYNHVDDFLGALPQHKGEFNLFRSTQSNLVNPTKYQLELHEEKIAEERKNLMYMYQKQPDVLKSVLSTYDRMAAERYKLIKASAKAAKVTDEAVANALRRQTLDHEIGELKTETGHFVPWRF